MIRILGPRGGEATLAKNPLAAGGVFFRTLTIEGIAFCAFIFFLHHR